MRNLIAAALLIVTGLMNLFPVGSIHSVHAESVPAPQMVYQAGSGLAVYPEWKMAQYGSGIGFAGLFAQDLDGDGAVEIVAEGNFAGGLGSPLDFWYVLRSSAPNRYDQVWYSEKYSSAIKRIAVADVDNDGTAEIFVGLADASVHVYRGSDYSEKASFKVGFAMRSMLLADADGNGSKELIISSDNRVTAYNPLSGELLWGVSSLGGDVAVGNVDTDPALEIVLSSGYVLDGATRAVEWHYTGGVFGFDVEVGDIDGDGMDEIAAAANYDKVTIFEADLKSPMWEIPTKDHVEGLEVADTNGDQRAEIVYGDHGWGAVHGVDGQTHKQAWQIENPGDGVTGIEVADVDRDQSLEVFWSASYNSIQPDYLYAADILSSQIEWQSEDLDGPYSAVDAGDVDDDGQPEIVAGANSRYSVSNDSVIKIINSTTHEVEWQTNDLPNLQVRYGIQSIRIGDVDQDGQTEFVIAADGSGAGLIQIYNGRSHELERQSSAYSRNHFTAAEIGDVDGDGQAEIVVGQSTYYSGDSAFSVVVLNGATAAEEWQGPALDTTSGRVYDIDLKDVDGDGRVEIIASVEGKNVYVFDGVTHTLEAKIVTQSYALFSADLDHDGTQSILVGRVDGRVDAYNGKTFALEADLALGRGQISCLSWADLDRNEVPEWLVCEENRLSIYSTADRSLLWQSGDMGSYLGLYNQVPAGQIDADEDLEILVGSYYTMYQFAVPWVGPFGLSTMKVSPADALPGDTLAFTIVLSNQGRADFPDVLMDNPLPAELSYVDNTLSATSGTAAYADDRITWSGRLDIQSPVTISYQANVRPDTPRASLVNSAQITGGGETRVISAAVHIPPAKIYVPFSLRDYCGDFFDSFDNPASGWPVKNVEDVQTRYVGGAYSLIATYSYAHVIQSPTCKRQNYIVEADARWTAGSKSSYGLAFDVKDNLSEYYFVTVDVEYQSYSLYYGYSSESSAGYIAISGDPSSAIRPGTAINHIKVIRDGSQIVLEINGVIVKTWTDTHMISGQTNTGLLIMPFTNSMKDEARFDNFKVTVLPQ